MGIHDRDYVWGKSSRAARPGLWSFNTYLITANIAVFILQIVMKPNAGAFMGMSPVEELGYFSTYKVTLQGGLEFWRFLTFQFLHSGMMHIFFNMLGLYMFGSMVEAHLGSKRYIAFYLTCGVCGGLAYLLLNAGGTLAEHYGVKVPGLLFNDTKTPLVGASAGVFGVILACAYIAPNLVVQLMIPPIPLKMRTFAYVYVGIAAVSVIFGSRNAGGEAAHLGGAAAGFVLIRRAHLLRDFFDIFTDSRKSTPKRPPVAPLRDARPNADEVDRILDKVRAQGIHALSDHEKSILRKATDQQRSGGTA